MADWWYEPILDFGAEVVGYFVAPDPSVAPMTEGGTVTAPTTQPGTNGRCRSTRRISDVLNQICRNTGQRWTSKEVLQAVRIMGVDKVAAQTGVSVSDISWVAVKTCKTRRRRGISAADKRAHSRVQRFLNTYKKQPQYSQK